MHKPNDIESWLAELGAPSADRDYLPGHARMLALLDKFPLKRPRRRIRVAGTNGKGSTAHMLAGALQSQGLRVGLYTSPHILSFNERIRINGVPVSDAVLHEALQQLMPEALRSGASYFETATALALKIFSDASVDVEVLEAGVGARLDATTAVAADMALIAPIALDHRAWLGETLAQIAEEKAYALHGCRFGFSALQAPEVVEILKLHGEVVFVPPDATLQPHCMPGAFQQQNAALACAGIRALQADGFVSSLGAAKEAIRNTVVLGRLQRLEWSGNDVWLDCAHNAHAVEALLPQLEKLAPFDAVLVFTREDRTLESTLPELKALTRRLAGPTRWSGLNAAYASVDEALPKELGGKAGGRFLILGSFLTVAAAMRWLEQAE